MRVVVAGGHGKIALRLERLLAASRHRVTGLIRNPNYMPEVRATGAGCELIDLESCTINALAALIDGAHAVVFAAGAGPNSGVARKDTVDRGAAVLLSDAAVAARVPRYVLISSTGVDREPDPKRGEVWAAYIRAKKAAEVEVARRPLALTVLRPGPLTDEPGAGRVALAPPGLDRVPVSRDDVAMVLVGLLLDRRAEGVVLELMGGETPIPDALEGVLAR